MNTYLRGMGEQVATFAEKSIRQTKGRWAGRPLEIEPFQREILDELFLLDSGGGYVYREGLVGVPRKNGKSTLAAAIALYGLIATPESGPEVYAAAASRDQARIVFNQAKEFVERSPALARHLRPMRSAITCPANNGVLRVLSSDAPLQHGLNPSLVVIDELWAHKDPELYYALTTGQLARENPLVLSITTAGWDRESIGWQVYDHGRALAEQGVEAMREARFYFRWFAAPSSADLYDREAWRTANPASWIDLDDLAREVDRLPEFVFRRLHLNQWTDLEDAWIAPDEWDACVGDPELDPEADTWFALDVGLKRDATALVWVSWVGEELQVGHEIIVPEAGRPLATADIRATIKRRAAEFAGLREIVFDPWAFRESAEMLAEEGFPMVEFEQSNARMAPASEKLYELIREGRIVHDGDNRLRKHLLAAVVSDSDRGWRISKRKSRERIDAAIALAMAADRAIAARKSESGSVYVF